MRLRKIFILLLVFGMIASLGYYFLAPSKSSKAKKALESLLQGQFHTTEKIIDELPPSFPIALYRGYLQQAQGKFRDSDLFLQQALASTRNENLLFEILLAQTVNSYLDQRDHEISPLLETAKKIIPSSSYLFLLEGLSHYSRGEFGDALRHWAIYEPEADDSWLGPLLQQHFSPSWLRLHLAHCMIEEGDILSAREILEREMHFMEPPDETLHDLGTLFLGLTYLKEAERFPLSERATFYKMARFYFERGSCSKPFWRENQALIASVQKEADSLLMMKPSREWGLGLIHILQDWNAKAALEGIAEHLVNALLEENDQELCLSLREEFLGAPFHNCLTEHLIATISARLREDELHDLFKLWRSVETLTVSTSNYARKIASLTVEEIFQMIDRDKENLSQTLAYLSFWNYIETNPLNRAHFAKGLLHHGELLWRREGQERKGIHLMDLALKLVRAEEQREFRKEIEAFLSTLYAQAESTNMVRRQSLIYDAFEHFKMGSKNFMTPSKVANYLADASYLYKTQNYASAQTHAEWVLKLSPKNQEALRLYGLSSYNLGEFNKAVASLKRVPNPDPDTRKALILSAAFSSQEQEPQLAQIEPIDDFVESE